MSEFVEIEFMTFNRRLDIAWGSQDLLRDNKICVSKWEESLILRSKPFVWLVLHKNAASGSESSFAGKASGHESAEGYHLCSTSLQSSPRLPDFDV